MYLGFCLNKIVFFNIVIFGFFGVIIIMFGKVFFMVLWIKGDFVNFLINNIVVMCWLEFFLKIFFICLMILLMVFLNNFLNMFGLIKILFFLIIILLLYLVL